MQKTETQKMLIETEYMKQKAALIARAQKERTEARQKLKAANADLKKYMGQLRNASEFFHIAMDGRVKKDEHGN